MCYIGWNFTLSGGRLQDAGRHFYTLLLMFNTIFTCVAYGSIWVRMNNIV